MCALMAVAAVIAAAAAIWGSALGCKVTCCARQMTGVCITVSWLLVCFFDRS